MIALETHGMIKPVADKATRKIIGVYFLADHTDTLIGAAVMMASGGMTLTQVTAAASDRAPLSPQGGGPQSAGRLGGMSLAIARPLRAREGMAARVEPASLSAIMGEWNRTSGHRAPDGWPIFSFSLHWSR